MKVAYVIGPYRAPTIAGIAHNIAEARIVASELWTFGFSTICPHLNSAFMDGLVPDQVFLDGCIDILKRCDVAVTVSGWEYSEGSRREVTCCEQYGIPVYPSAVAACASEMTGSSSSQSSAPDLHTRYVVQVRNAPDRPWLDVVFRSNVETATQDFGDAVVDTSREWRVVERRMMAREIVVTLYSPARRNCEPQED